MAQAKDWILRQLRELQKLLSKYELYEDTRLVRTFIAYPDAPTEACDYCSRMDSSGDLFVAEALYDRIEDAWVAAHVTLALKVPHLDAERADRLWSKTVQLIQALERMPPNVPVAPPGEALTKTVDRQRRWGLIASVAGLVALGTSVILMVRKKDWKELL